MQYNQDLRVIVLAVLVNSTDITDIGRIKG